MANTDLAPIDDPRPFAQVLADWQARHGLTNYATAPILQASRTSVGHWSDGRPCQYERAMRALMTLHDEGRIVGLIDARAPKPGPRGPYKKKS